MTPLQETELDLLRQFHNICTQLELPYFLVCGSALGAVKYGGFIPWDDDIDVAMYRKDYRTFLEKAPNLLPEGLFLQNYQTDPAFPQIFSKLRNTNTTYIEKTAAHLPINHGIFIDIFPLDGYPENAREQKKLEFRKRLYASMLLSAYDFKRTGLGKLRHGVFRLLGVPKHTQAVARAYEKRISAWPVEGSKRICNHGNWQGSLEYAPAWHYGKGASASFAGLQVRIPEHYSAYLTQKYGDYTQELPPEEQKAHHDYTICDCYRPYTDYQGGKTIEET